MDKQQWIQFTSLYDLQLFQNYIRAEIDSLQFEPKCNLIVGYKEYLYDIST